jgi:hypothetical protein
MTTFTDLDDFNALDPVSPSSRRASMASPTSFRPR